MAAGIRALGDGVISEPGLDLGAPPRRLDEADDGRGLVALEGEVSEFLGGEPCVCVCIIVVVGDDFVIFGSGYWQN